jgi:hypothetical protein
MQKYFFEKKSVSYAILFAVDLVFINFLFKHITHYVSVNLFVLITSGLISIFTYKLCMFLFKFAFLNANSDSNLSYLSKFLFENEYLYKLLVTDTNQMQPKANCLSKQASQLFDLTNEATDSVLEVEIKAFSSRFSEYFIQSWYIRHVSTNDEFVSESKMQLEYLLSGLLKKFSTINKLSLCQEIAFTFNENFLNMASNNAANKDLLHSALQSSPKTEIEYMKNCVQFILKKFSYNARLLNDSFVSEFFLQIVGKNCLEKSINLLSQPNFIFYSIILLCGKSYELGKKRNMLVENIPDSLDSKVQKHISATSSSKELCIEQTVFDLNKPDADKDYENLTDTESDLHSLMFDFKTSTDELDSNELRFSESDSTDTNNQGTMDTLSSIDNDHDADSSRFYHNDIGSMSVKILTTETDYDSKTGTPFTLFNVQVI